LIIWAIPFVAIVVRSASFPLWDGSTGRSPLHVLGADSAGLWFATKQSKVFFSHQPLPWGRWKGKGAEAITTIRGPISQPKKQGASWRKIRMGGASSQTSGIGRSDQNSL